MRLLASMIRSAETQPTVVVWWMRSGSNRNLPPQAEGLSVLDGTVADSLVPEEVARDVAPEEAPQDARHYQQALQRSGAA